MISDPHLRENVDVVCSSLRLNELSFHVLILQASIGATKFHGKQLTVEWHKPGTVTMLPVISITADAVLSLESELAAAVADDQEEDVSCILI
jgi:hypothetical protein